MLGDEPGADVWLVASFPKSTTSVTKSPSTLATLATLPTMAQFWAVCEPNTRVNRRRINLPPPGPTGPSLAGQVNHTAVASRRPRRTRDGGRRGWMRRRFASTIFIKL
jgi:hypothetical protein